MSCSSIRSSDPLNNDPSPLNTPLLLRSYPLAQGKKLEVFFDFIRGAQVVAHEEGRIQEIPFCDSGIPHELRFRCKALSCYLEDTYASFDGTKVLIQGRIKGGGHSSHSSHSQSSYTPPPPPRRIHINYSAGYLITGVSRPDIAGGTFKEESGGVGCRNYSVVFETHNASLKPLVKLQVNKSEFRAADISRLRTEQNITSSKLSAASWESSDLQSRIQSAQAVEQQHTVSIQQKQKELRDLNGDQSNQIKLRNQETSFNSLNARFQENGPMIRSLLTILDLNEQYQLGINLESDALRTFLLRKSEISALVTTNGTSPSLMGKCASSVQYWVEDTRKSLGKNIIALVGNTGTGKSTLVNFLLGSPIVYDAATQTMQVAPGHQEFAKIGNQTTTSQTLYTQVHQNSTHVFADCGGFLDTRGDEKEFQAMASLKATLSHAASVKLLICFDTNVLTTDRGTLFSACMQTVCRDFIREYQTYPSSMMLVLTKPSLERSTGALFSVADAVDKIKGLRDGTDSTELQRIYDFLLREEGKYISVCDPTEETSRTGLVHMLDTMKPISSKEAFGIPCSPSLKSTLFTEMTSTAQQGTELYESRKTASTEIDRLRQLVSTQERNKQALTAEITRLEGMLTAQRSEVARIRSAWNTACNTLSQLQQKQATQTSDISNWSTGSMFYHNYGDGWTVSA